jgi:hypothetical protein
MNGTQERPVALGVMAPPAALICINVAEGRDDTIAAGELVRSAPTFFRCS